MTWYIIGMIITYFCATQKELEAHTWQEVLILLCVWPVPFGFMLNELRMDLKHIRDNVHTHYHPQQDNTS